jgi:hypothetical protein
MEIHPSAYRKESSDGPPRQEQHRPGNS